MPAGDRRDGRRCKRRRGGGQAPSTSRVSTRAAGVPGRCRRTSRCQRPGPEVRTVQFQCASLDRRDRCHVVGAGASRRHRAAARSGRAVAQADRRRRRSRVDVEFFLRQQAMVDRLVLRRRGDLRPRVGCNRALEAWLGRESHGRAPVRRTSLANATRHRDSAARVGRLVFRWSSVASRSAPPID